MRSILLTASILFAAVAVQAGSYETVAVKDGGNIVGRVSFVGTPPAREKLPVIIEQQTCGEYKLSRTIVVGDDGGLHNAVVRLPGISRGKAWEEREYTLGQTDCRFEPHVLLLADGADLRILNSDRIAHNIRTLGEGPVFNVGQPKFVEKLLIEGFTNKLSNPEIVRVGCDLHPWMTANIVIQQHPYYAVTDEKGSFRLADVPPGTYDLLLWHETLGEQKRKVRVEPNVDVTVDFELGL